MRRWLRCVPQIDNLQRRRQGKQRCWVTYSLRQYDLALKQFEDLGDDVGLINTTVELRMYPEAIASNKRWSTTHPQDLIA